MTAVETYKNAFVQALEISEAEVEQASMETVARWDSIGQMSLIAIVEDAFGIEMEPDEIMQFTTYASGLDILRRHNIDV